MSKNLNEEFDLKHDQKHVDEVAYSVINENKPGNGSSFGAYFNLINALAGSGTLGLPAALKQGGWLGVLLIFLGAIFSIYTGNLLVKVMNDRKSKVKIETYPDVGYAAFGIAGRSVVQFCQYSIICGGVTLYLVLAGTNVGGLINEAYGTPTAPVLLERYWICIAGLIVWIPFAFLKTVQEISYISAFGTLATIICIVISVSLGLLNLPDPGTVNYTAVDWQGIPIALATISFSYGGTVVYPHVYRSMRRPEHWKYVLTAATGTAFVLYTLIAAACYYAFGDQTMSPIFKNLPHVPARSVAIVFISCHVLAASPVFLCSFSLEIERWLKINVDHMGKKKELIVRVILRTFIVAVLVLIGNLVPYFGSLMSLVGAVSECMLIFIVPIFCHLRVFGIRGRRPIEYPWIVLILFIAFVCLIFGTKDAVLSLISDIENDPNRIGS